MNEHGGELTQAPNSNKDQNADSELEFLQGFCELWEAGSASHKQKTESYSW